MTRHTIELDTLVIGGGIAGLWLANRLQSAGYSVALLEQAALGSDQSVASQGMIHGGVKYALSGALTGASEAIADMPGHWRACLAGRGDVDLTGVPVLSDHFYMWASQSVTARVATFFASKALRGRVDGLRPDEYPDLFQAAGQKFSLYKLVDLVLDVPALVAKLAGNLGGRCRLLDWRQASWQLDAGRASLLVDNTLVRARRIILTAGRGNAELLSALGTHKPEMQLRPLTQVMVKHRLGYRFYGHCLGADKTPRLTISSHEARDGDLVWYLGGSLAEQGVGMPAEQLIARAQAELRALMPWLDFSGAQWATWPVDRAEPRQRNFARPDQAFAGRAEGVDNVYVGWPTKLTLAPNLGNAMLALLDQDGIRPSGACAPLEFLLPAPVAATPWDIAFTSNH